MAKIEGMTKAEIVAAANAMIPNPAAHISESSKVLELWRWYSRTHPEFYVDHYPAGTSPAPARKERVTEADLWRLIAKNVKYTHESSQRAKAGKKLTLGRMV